jgi:hypothetical protein
MSVKSKESKPQCPTIASVIQIIVTVELGMRWSKKRTVHQGRKAGVVRVDK